jgi:hypothetical protein
MHYLRWRKYGDPGFVKLNRHLTLVERIDRFRDRSGGPLACWLWRGELDRDGYGSVNIGHGKHARAHRVAYEIAVGPIPEGLVIDHRCRNRPCCNPSHLEPVPSGVNVMRGIGLGPMNAAKSHCKNGHEFTDDNTAFDSAGYRVCRHCRLESYARYRARMRATRRSA